MGYHIAKIERGVLGEISKIREEFEELRDAATQDNKILCLCEVADLYGAIEAYLETQHKNVTMEDVKKMSDATKSAFKDGER